MAHAVAQAVHQQRAHLRARCQDYLVAATCLRMRGSAHVSLCSLPGLIELQI